MVVKVVCPLCACPSRLEMRGDSCLFLWEWPVCRQLVRPKPGDCCVVCSYGSFRCPTAAWRASGPDGGPLRHRFKASSG